MYCHHCGYKINEHKIEAKRSSYNTVGEDVVDEDTEVGYICPRCGRVIKANLSEENVKSLSQASHAEIQRARNFFANGMGLVSVGSILLVISIIFFFLAKKPSNQFVLVTSCAEFYVFIVLLVISSISLICGIINVIIGLVKKNRYATLLHDINNRTFIQ